MKKNVLIVNGNTDYAEELRKMVLEVNPYVEIWVAYDAKTALDYLMNITMDLFILDIILYVDMQGDVSGLRLAEQIREITKYVLTPMIFVTTKEDPELYTYEELNCIGYFVRPFALERFYEKVERGLCYRTPRNEEKALLFRKAGIFYPIRIKEIVYIEYNSHDMWLHLADGSVVEVLYKTSRTILYEADSEVLFQCSRGVLLNKNYIHNLDLTNGYIELKNNLGTLVIGSTYKKRIKEILPEIIL